MNHLETYEHVRSIWSSSGAHWSDTHFKSSTESGTKDYTRTCSQTESSISIPNRNSLDYVPILASNSISEVDNAYTAGISGRPIADTDHMPSANTSQAPDLTRTNITSSATSLSSRRSSTMSKTISPTGTNITSPTSIASPPYLPHEKSLNKATNDTASSPSYFSFCGTCKEGELAVLYSSDIKIWASLQQFQCPTQQSGASSAVRQMNQVWYVVSTLRATQLGLPEPAIVTTSLFTPQIQTPFCRTLSFRSRSGLFGEIRRRGFSMSIAKLGTRHTCSLSLRVAFDTFRIGRFGRFCLG